MSKIKPDDELSKKMSNLYVAECNAVKARLEVETECQRLLAEDYEKTMAKIEEYSKKLEAPILAKISDAGYFCDSHVVRTNQVTMAMGGEYFAECSLHTARKIVARRVAEARKSHEDGKESIKMVSEKIKFCEENFSALESGEEGQTEIVEMYDEEAEKLFYEKRKLRKEGKKIGIDAAEAKPADVEHEKMMERLEELEELEEHEHVHSLDAPVPKPFELPADELVELEELEELDEEDLEIVNERLLAQPGVSREEMEKLLQYLDACDEESEEDEEEEEEEEEEREENDENKVVELDSDDYASDEEKGVKIEEKKTVQKVTVVETNETTIKKKTKKTLRFAKQLEHVKTFLKSDTVQVKREDSPPETTKSILVSKTPTPVDRTVLEPEQKELQAMSTVSFPGEIVEKNPYVCLPSTSKDPAPVITEPKISKFRASRSRN
uniref:Uncharacterized protein n=1 Tax=Caenorhabditis japonica TaxID=281687 RepID=A0A8R1DM23_CAEJA